MKYYLFFSLYIYCLNFILHVLIKKFLLYLQPRSNGIIIIQILEQKILLECLWDQQEILTLTGEEGCLCQWITWVHHFQVPCLTWVIHQVHLILLVGEFSHRIHLCLQDTWCHQFLGISFSIILIFWEGIWTATCGILECITYKFVVVFPQFGGRRVLSSCFASLASRLQHTPLVFPQIGYYNGHCWKNSWNKSFFRDLSELAVNSMGMNMGPPVGRREEFEHRKPDGRRREMDRFNGRWLDFQIIWFNFFFFWNLI